MDVERDLRGSARLGNYLRRLRSGYGLSLRRVEEKAKADGGEIDNSQLSRYERGKCYPSFDKLCVLANIFNVPIQNFSDLLDLEHIEQFEIPHSAEYEDLKAEANREWEQGNFARAYAIYEAALARLEDPDGPTVDPDRLARARFNLARTLLRMGKISLAETELRIILREHRSIKPATQALVLLCLADAHDDKGDGFLAILEAEKCLEIARSIGHTEYEGYALLRLASTRFEQGDYEMALDSFREARVRLETIASPHDLTLIRANIGYCLAMSGKPERGLRELRESLQVASREGFRRCAAYALLHIGLVHEMKDEPKQARDAFEEAELMAHGGEERYVDILFQTAYRLWEMSRVAGNQVQEKVYFGRLKFLRPQLDRRFIEVEKFDRHIENGKAQVKS
ncbi:MAG TPA: helix-turn-helix domain-containing protein [Candidatus Polarisedimenticolia bacterium]|nr:helix-turn-helix domain-containing protein [Candidatus Polarisedimenticolia bacterium]